MKPSEALTQAKALIADPANHTKGAYCRSKTTGNAIVMADSTQVGDCQFCSVGAINQIVGSDWRLEARTKQTLSHAIREMQQTDFSDLVSDVIINFNDSREHADVMKAFDTAIQIAKTNEAKE